MKIEKIDKWLDDKYGISYTELVKIKEYLVEENEKLKEKNNDLNKIIENINAISYQSADEIWLKARHDIEDLDDFANDIDHYIAPYITYNYKSHLKAIIKYLVRLFKQHCDYK